MNDILKVVVENFLMNYANGKDWLLHLNLLPKNLDMFSSQQKFFPSFSMSISLLICISDVTRLVPLYRHLQ